MNIDGIFLRQIIQSMRQDLPFRINRITQPDQYSLFFNGYSQSVRKLLISIDPRQSSFHWTKYNPKENLHASPKLMLFRKHLENGWIEDIVQNGQDRSFYLSIKNRNELGEIVHYKLFIELLGRFTNIILCDDEQVIIEAFRHQSNFESEARIILPQEKYEIPQDQEKKSLFALEEKDLDPKLYQDYEGVSPLLAKEINWRFENGENIPDILDALNSSEELYYYKDGKAHIIEMKHLKEKAQVFPLLKGLDEIYQYENLQHQINLRKKKIQNQMRREIKREKKRIERLNSDLNKAENADDYRLYGDLLFTYMPHLKAGQKEVELEDFEGKEHRIVLKEHLNGKENAQDYYRRYQKAQRSLDHLDREIKIAQQKLQYFEMLLSQSEWADLESLDEMIDELEEENIIKKQKRPIAKKRKKKPSYLSVDRGSYRIYVGRNNQQNEHISFKLAKKGDLWFHVANAPGSHVLLKQDQDEFSEEMILEAALLAAHFSKKRFNQKAEVHWTQAEKIEKIKGAPKGLVKMKEHQSIMVELDTEAIEQLIGNML